MCPHPPINLSNALNDFIPYPLDLGIQDDIQDSVSEEEHVPDDCLSMKLPVEQ